MSRLHFSYLNRIANRFTFGLWLHTISMTHWRLTARRALWTITVLALDLWTYIYNVSCGRSGNYIVEGADLYSPIY
jgi:hypothetical protein